jgi:hypothetical protein
MFGCRAGMAVFGFSGSVEQRLSRKIDPTEAEHRQQGDDPRGFAPEQLESRDPYSRPAKAPVLPACDMPSAHPAAIRRILQCKRVVGLLQNVADRLQLSLPAS